MSSEFNPATWQRLWSDWNIQGCMIFAFFMQLFLAVGVPIRRTTSNRFLIFILWCTYLLADWTAVFAYGLITNSVYRSCSGQSSQVAIDNLALWAAFLLVHLGGSDSITAFSLEDNTLWPRHLVGLVTQVTAFIYIFGKTLSSKNFLIVPTILVFVSGVISYGERSRSLYLASLDRMKRSGDQLLLLLNPSEIHPSWRSAYQFSQTLKGLVVDVMPSNAKLQESREFFLNEEAEAALEVLTKEMSFLYHMLYTKTLALRSSWGYISRFIHSVNLHIVVLWLNVLKVQEQHKFDDRITELFVYEAIVLEAIGIFLYVQPCWAVENFSDCRFSPRTLLQIPKKFWSEAMGTFDLLTYCFKEITQSEGRWCSHAIGSVARKIGMAEIIVEMKYVSKIRFDIQLWKFVFDKLKVSLGTDTNSLAIDVIRSRELYEARGNLALDRANCDDLMHFIKDFEFDSTLLMWHIATLICYHIDEAFGVDEIDNREFGEKISNYMVYLMVKQTKLMSPVIGIGYNRYIDTCEEMKCRGRGFNTTDMKDFCIKLLAQNEDNNGDPRERGKSVLLDSCDLARILLTKDTKWKIISEVWVELLSHAAGHCRADSYARLLAEGGEFISFVWLLMAHLGIGPRVPVE